MRRTSTAIIVLATLLLASSLWGASAIAADAEMESHPLVGAWAIETSTYKGVRDHALLLVDDGSWVKSVDRIGSRIGAWEPIGALKTRFIKQPAWGLGALRLQLPDEAAAE